MMSLIYKNIHKTIGSVESLTGGLFALTIIKIPGASKFFKGSVVAYDSKIKEKLGVDISKGVVNPEAALEMARKGKIFLDVDICVAFTGIAGPETVENKEVGLCYIAINKNVYKKNFSGSREKVMKSAVDFAIIKLKEIYNF